MQPNKKACSILLKTYCSNNCIFCSPDPSKNRLKNKQLNKLKKDIHDSIIEFKSEKYRSIEISGGDPLEYGYLADLIKTLRQNGFKRIRISTNGVRLRDIKLTKEILKCGVDIFRVPIYGSTPQIHDSVTQTENSFKHTISGIKNIKKINNTTKILLISLLLKQNASDLIYIFDLMNELGCDDLYFAPPFISNGNYSYYIPHKLQGYFFRKLIKHAQNTKHQLYLRDTPYCVIGFDNDFLTNTGKVAHLGSRFQPRGHQKTNVIDLPLYRKKTKIEMCKKCAVAHKCDGFLINDIIRYGIGSLKPLRHKI